MIRDLLSTWGMGPWMALCGIALVACVAGFIREVLHERRHGDTPWL